MKAELELFFTVDQVSQALAVSSRTIRRAIEDQSLLAHRIGRLIRIAKKDLDAFLRDRR